MVLKKTKKVFVAAYCYAAILATGVALLLKTLGGDGNGEED
jgi:hypothetical protein